MQKWYSKRQKWYFGEKISENGNFAVPTAHEGTNTMEICAEVDMVLGCSRLSFASAEHMEKFLDITPGSVSVLGLMNDKDKAVRLAIDRSVLDEEYVGCHPCINTSCLKIKVSDLLEKILPALGYEPAIVDLPTYAE